MKYYAGLILGILFSGLYYPDNSPDSGIPKKWAANGGLPGVHLLTYWDKNETEAIKQQVRQVKKMNNVVILSIHWGGNWGYSISGRQQEFARQLIDEAGVDIIFGHSSHHPLGLEVYKGKLIIYGAGDFINDYEGISGHEEYRGELTCMYFPQINTSSGRLKSLKLVPMEIKNFRLNHASEKDAKWLQKTLNREGKKMGTSVRKERDNILCLEW